jgi:hypothetical protein
MTHTPANSDEQRTVVIAKPDHPPIRLGPLAPAKAEDWAGTLRFHVGGSAPEGTVIEVTQYNPGTGPHINPGTIPRTVEDLVEPLRADPGYPANGGWPDLYDRVRLVNGTTRGDAMWTEACGRIDAETQYQDAKEQAATDAADAADLLAQAHTATQQALALIRRMLGTEDTWDLAALPGGIIDSQDAQHHAVTAVRELRAARRILASAYAARDTGRTPPP